MENAMRTEAATHNLFHQDENKPTRPGFRPTRGVRDLPERVRGQVSDIWINRGPTIATARVGHTVGRYAADLWRIEGNPLPWRVRADGEGVRRFGDETTAVTFFLDTVRKVADGEGEEILEGGFQRP
jgi:hypothetical protein